VGIVRLHPAKDGLLPHPHERGLTVRDRGGNRLRDIISPETGFCTGVASPLTFSPKDAGLSVLSPKPPSGGKGSDIRYDDDSARYYDLIRSDASAPVGLVVRLVSDGDDKLPCARVRVVEAAPSPSRESERNCSAPVQKSVSTRKQNDQAVKAILDAHGYEGKITPEIRKVVLEMIAMEKSVSGKDGTYA
jgi:hypothetical protein